MTAAQPLAAAPARSPHTSADTGADTSADTGAGTGAEPIARRAATPMYHQLRHRIIDDIERRALKAGDLLPSEHQLCTMFGVSRTVVRQALLQLEHQGIIDRVKGKGTFVAQRTTPESLAHTLTGLYEDVASRGGHVTSDVRRQEVVPADDVVADALAVEAGEAVVLLERLRYVDGEPWAWVSTYLPLEIGELVLDEDLRERSLYALLAGHGIRMASGIRSAEAAVADEAQGRLLQVGAGAPLLVLRSVGHDSTGRVMEYFVAHHRGDRSRFEFSLGAAPPSGTTLRHVDYGDLPAGPDL